MEDREGRERKKDGEAEHPRARSHNATRLLKHQQFVRERSGRYWAWKGNLHGGLQFPRFLGIASQEFFYQSARVGAAFFLHIERDEIVNDVLGYIHAVASF